ncbi:MAG: MarR family winged helix-turn-helix transcriptional regulator [Aeromicrobium sp.]
MADASQGWSGGDPDAFMALTLVRVSQAMSRLFSATLAPHQLAPHHFSVLLHLVEQPGLSQAALAREVLATPQSVGELLRTMEERGMIERTPPAGPGLPIAVHASPAGRALLDEVTPHVLAAFSPETLGIDEETAARLNLDLHTILATLAP